MDILKLGFHLFQREPSFGLEFEMGSITIEPDIVSISFRENLLSDTESQYT